LGDAIEAAMDFVDANPEARKTFEKHLKENRSDLVAGKKKAKRLIEVKSREGFKKAVNELVPQISDEDIERLAVVGDAMVKYVLKLDPSLTASEAWEQVQGHITNDINLLQIGFEQPSNDGLDEISEIKNTTRFLQDANLGEKIDELKKIIKHGKRNANRANNLNTRTDSGVREVQAPRQREVGASKIAELDRVVNSESTRKEWGRKEKDNGAREIQRSNGKPIIERLFTGHKIAFDKFDRAFRGSGIRNQGGGIFFTIDPIFAADAAEKSANGGYAFNPQTPTYTPFVSEVKITGDNILYAQEAIPKETVKQIGVVIGVAPSKYKSYDSFLDALQQSFVVDKKDFTDLIEAQDKAADALRKKGVIGHVVDANEIVIYDEGDISKTNQTRIFKSDEELIASAYHQAKTKGTNPKLVDAVENLIGSPNSHKDALFQGVKGATSIDQGITAYTEAADVSTLIHEPAHNFLGLLEFMAANGNAKATEHIKVVDDFAKSGEGKKFFDRSKAAGETWAQGEFNENDPTFRQELFARSAEKYFMEGVRSGLSARMAEVFKSFSKFLQELYKGIKNGPEHIEISDKMRSLFDASYPKEMDQLNSEIPKLPHLPTISPPPDGHLCGAVAIGGVRTVHIRAVGVVLGEHFADLGAQNTLANAVDIDDASKFFFFGQSQGALKMF
jgi:hypothetical protein